MNAASKLTDAELAEVAEQLNAETRGAVTIRSVDVSKCIDSRRASCTECAWSDVTSPDEHGRSHAAQFGHDVTVSHVTVAMYSLRPKREGER